MIIISTSAIGRCAILPIPCAATATYEAVPPRFRQVLFRDWNPRDSSAHTEEVEVYTNAQQVELTLNGKSLGTQKLHADATSLTWQVPFAPGALKAIATSDGKVVATDELRTAGKTAKLLLTGANGTTLSPDWNDVRQLAVRAVDSNGVPVPDNDTVVHFSVAGPGQIIGVDNGSNTDHDSFQSNDRSSSRAAPLPLFEPMHLRAALM